MVNAQEWLDHWYPKEGVCILKKKFYLDNETNNFGKTRKEIIELDVSYQLLAGFLDLTDFSNLKELYCGFNQLTNLDVSKNVNLKVLSCFINELTNLDVSKNVELNELDCSKNQLTNLDVSKNVELEKLSCSDNQLTSVEFLNALPHTEKLENLVIYNNNIQPTDIALFSKFTNLKILKIGTTGGNLARGKHNKFYGSLRAYQNLTKLESICIEATDVDSGLEYLPASLVTSIKQEKGEKGKYDRIECSPRGLPNAGCKAIQDQLRPLNYDLAAWQLVNTKYPNLTKQIGELNQKILGTQQELNQLGAKHTNEKKRLENKISLLQKKIIELEAELQMEREEAKKALEKAQEWRERQLKEMTDRKDKKISETQQNHTEQLNQILKILGTTTTNLAPLTSPSDNNTLANLVQEQVAASQAERENREREIEQLKEVNAKQQKTLEENNQKITKLAAKISETEQKLVQVREQDTNKTAKIEQIKSELTGLEKVKSQLETRFSKESREHRNHLQKLFSLLDTTTASRNLDRFNDNDVIYNRVKEKIQTQQEENRQALANYRQQISELEEIINSFQNQIERVNRENLDWEERFEKLNDDYVDMRAAAGGLKVATNTLKNQWRKAEQELKTNREAWQNDLNLFTTILNKQKELKILEDSLKRKLENQSLLESLLTSQELLTNLQLTNTPERVIKLITLQLTQIKSELAVKITSEEINQLCQVKHELAKLELELEKLLPVNLEAKVEIR